MSAALVKTFEQHLLTRSADALRPSTVNAYISALHNLHKTVLHKTGASVKQAELLSPWNDRVPLPTDPARQNPAERDRD